MYKKFFITLGVLSAITLLVAAFVGILPGLIPLFISLAIMEYILTGSLHTPAFRPLPGSFGYQIGALKSTGMAFVIAFALVIALILGAAIHG